MKLEDKYGMKYEVVKKNGNYYLITALLDKYTNKRTIKVEVKGKENINMFIKNNKLEVVK